MVVKDASSFYLIVGLGNPGDAYDYTRHNVGFHILEHFAKKRGWIFKTVSTVQGRLAQGVLKGKKVLLLLPMTYMNSSGSSVRLVIDYFKVSTDNMMVISDEISLPFGALRIKPSGSSGGHNGLKSIETHLSSQIYPRMRVGVGNKTHGTLADYVLSRLSEDEIKHSSHLFDRAVAALEVWIEEGIVKAMQIANGRQEEKKPESNVGE